MDSRFDAYEFIAVLPAGLVLSVGVALLWPYGIDQHQLSGLGSAGIIGVALIFAFVFGHLVRILTSFLEQIAWRALGGWPTDQIHMAPDVAKGSVDHGLFILRRRELVTDDQFSRIDAKLKSLTSLGVDEPGPWGARVREIYARVANASRSGRVDMFNRTYGMFTALALVFAILTAISAGWMRPWQISVLLGVCCLLCVGGAGFAGKNYAQELYLQFILL